jgi:hypothetical protein
MWPRKAHRFDIKSAREYCFLGKNVQRFDVLPTRPRRTFDNIMRIVFLAFIPSLINQQWKAAHHFDKLHGPDRGRNTGASRMAFLVTSGYHFTASDQHRPAGLHQNEEAHIYMMGRPTKHRCPQRRRRAQRVLICGVYYEGASCAGAHGLEKHQGGATCVRHIYIVCGSNMRRPRGAHIKGEEWEGNHAHGTTRWCGAVGKGAGAAREGGGLPGGCQPFGRLQLMSRAWPVSLCSFDVHCMVGNSPS